MNGMNEYIDHVHQDEAPIINEGVAMLLVNLSCQAHDLTYE